MADLNKFRFQQEKGFSMVNAFEKYSARFRNAFWKEKQVCRVPNDLV